MRGRCDGNGGPPSRGRTVLSEETLSHKRLPLAGLMTARRYGETKKLSTRVAALRTTRRAVATGIAITTHVPIARAAAPLRRAQGPYAATQCEVRSDTAEVFAHPNHPPPGQHRHLAQRQVLEIDSEALIRGDFPASACQHVSLRPTRRFEGGATRHRIRQNDPPTIAARLQGRQVRRHAPAPIRTHLKIESAFRRIALRLRSTSTKWRRACGITCASANANPPRPAPSSTYTRALPSASGPGSRSRRPASSMWPMMEACCERPSVSSRSLKRGTLLRGGTRHMPP